MEINAKPPINPTTSETLKKPSEKENREEKKPEDSKQSVSSAQSPDYRVNLSKESLNAAAKIGLDDEAAETDNAEKTADREAEAKKIASAASQQLSGLNYSMTTPSAQKLFETFV